MAKKDKRNTEIDCSCLDLFEEATKVYRFSDCEIIKKCVKDGTLKESDSICIYGKESCGKTLLLTELLVDLSAVKELRGMNCKVAFLDCDLSFNYNNYENMISKKFEKYISNNNVDIYDKYEKDQLKKELLERSFSNVYYIPIFNPGHLLVILNSLKKLLEQKNFIKALFIDSISFWNFCKYDKINFFSNNNYVKRNTLELLDYAFTLILNLKKRYKFLFFYTKLCNEDKFVEYTINLSMNENIIEPQNNIKAPQENRKENNTLFNKSSTFKKEYFLIPHNFNDIIKTHIFRKKDFVTKNFLIEKPFFIFLIPNEKKQFTYIDKKCEHSNLNFLMCLSSEMKNPNKTQYSKFFFRIVNSHTIVPL
ncbi:P-loop containing nucleoside triphosphate hydrolase, putative [Plasmodium vinckei]|uniref:P-loop containing nucleoside triphosphate hydrolase, putative n=1 Tax=Plasmodium vinckei TaxID=5860 RepID=A0A6V7T0J1_PLAVN|nr:P-loop containing nucleoside triphosphate hydrolase, putative [Plasmodium vinckei]